MKVLHFCKSYFPDNYGGIETTINQICLGTKALGIESEILCLTPNKEESTIEINGIKVHRVPQLMSLASTPLSFKILKRYAEIAKDFDVINFHFPWPMADLTHLVSGLNKPSVVLYHSDIVKQKTILKFYKPLMNRFLSSVDAIVATSPNYAASSEVLHQYAHKVSVIPFGLSRASYPQPSEERLNYWRERFPSRFFLFIGILRYYKGAHALIDAAKGLYVPVVLIGAGGIESELKAQAEEINASNVHFLGALSDEDKVALLMLSYGVILPSQLRSEAFGISLLEGAMYGKPLISCEIGTGTTYINIHGQTGIVIPPEYPYALHQAMKNLLDNPDKAAELGQGAAKRFEELFTEQKMAKSYADLYRKVMENKR